MIDTCFETHLCHSSSLLLFLLSFDIDESDQLYPMKSNQGFPFLCSLRITNDFSMQKNKSTVAQLSTSG